MESISQGVNIYQEHYLLNSRLKKKINVYLFLRETETECEQGRGRDRGRQNPEQPPGSEQVVSTELDVGLELTN